MTIVARFFQRMRERWILSQTVNVLNNPPGSQLGQDALPVQLHAILRHMKAFAFADGRRVDYEALRGSGILQAFRAVTRQLHHLQPADLGSRGERLAFWINVYNGLVLDAVLQWDIQKSVQEVPGFFWRAGYCIGGHRFSAADIEHRVLGASGPDAPGVQAAGHDPGPAFAMPAPDLRTPFALSLAARAGPDLEVYAPEQVDEQLEQAAERFVNGKGVKLLLSRNTVWLSTVFQRVANGTKNHTGRGKVDDLLELLAHYRLDLGEARFLATQKPKIRYMEFDWSLNA